MRFCIFVFFLCTAVGAGHAQEGFSNKYDFGSGASFHNVLLNQDTLVIAGTTKDATSNRWGFLFVKMDTSGNVISQKLHLDTMEGQYAFDKGYPMIRTMDGGYLAAGVLFNRDSYFILKMTVNGDLEFMVEYPYPQNIITSFPNGLIETIDGYLIFSTKQLSDFSLNVFVTKIDLQGEVQWEQPYGNFLGEGVSSVWKKDEDTFVIGAFKGTTVTPVPNGIKCSQSWLFAIDGTGEVKWEWFGEPCESGRSYGLRPTDDGGWVYSTARLEVYDQWNFGWVPKLVKLDGDFNTVWERQVGESYGGSNIMIDFEQTPDGGWLGVGTWVQPEPYYGWSNEDIYIPGCTMKFTANGDSLWARFDTLAVPENTGSYYFGGMVVLPSGSSIAVGSFREDPPGTGNQKSWAWALKLDGNGCLDNDCAFTSTAESAADESGFTVYPNPAKDYVTFQWHEVDGFSGAVLYITDLTGRMVWEEEMGGKGGRTVWETGHVKDGIYFYRLKDEQGVLFSGKVIIQK